jgi:large subunit ribosomal protein L9e
MKDISSVESLVIPEGVTVALKARTITVTGPRGTLTKNVRHIQMDMQIVSGRNGRIGRWMGQVAPAWDGGEQASKHSGD